MFLQVGGLLDVLLPAWHHGVPVLAYRAAKFDPEEAFWLISKYNVRNAFLPPTALKMMRDVSAPWQRYAYKMRSIGVGGETLGEELLEWGRRCFGITINEFYGQTECNLVLGNCVDVMPVIPGSIGRPVPGHCVEVCSARHCPVEGVVCVHACVLIWWLMCSARHCPVEGVVCVHACVCMRVC